MVRLSELLEKTLEWIVLALMAALAVVVGLGGPAVWRCFKRGPGACGRPILIAIVVSASLSSVGSKSPTTHVSVIRASSVQYARPRRALSSTSWAASSRWARRSSGVTRQTVLSTRCGDDVNLSPLRDSSRWRSLRAP